MTLALKRLLAERGMTQRQMARATGLSLPTVCDLLNHERWPSANTARPQITQFLRAHGIPIASALRKEKASPGSRPARPTHPTQQEQGECPMLLRKQTLSAAARQHFGLSSDPFADCRELPDVFLSPDIRYVRQAMMDKCRHGGAMAVIGESGAGKSTLREELIEKLSKDDSGVIVIQPYVVAMEENDTRGKTLKAAHIAEAIMATIAPLSHIKSSHEARFRQLHEALRDSSRTGARHVLIIEEAHALPVPTLKHLKRFLELKDGLRPLLAVILLGQSELLLKLSEQDANVREVVQRIEIVHLPPLDNDLAAYITHRLTRAGAANADKIVERGAIDAIRSKLAPRRDTGSLLHPLAVNNVLARAMNAAAELGAPTVTAEFVGAAGAP